MAVPRRTLLLSAAGAFAAHAVPSSNPATLGVIGSGGRGTFVMGVFQKDPAVRVSAICDVYERNLENAISVPSMIPSSHPKAYRNYRELPDDRDVEAALIATPEHWHYQMVLDALAAGKDVYVEKPLGAAFGGSKLRRTPASNILSQSAVDLHHPPAEASASEWGELTRRQARELGTRPVR